MPASRSEPDTPLWLAMEKAASSIIKGAALVPVMLPGATDCRHYRGLGGAVAYGANLLEPSMTFGLVAAFVVVVVVAVACAFRLRIDVLLR